MQAEKLVKQMREFLRNSKKCTPSVTPIVGFLLGGRHELKYMVWIFSVGDLEWLCQTLNPNSALCCLRRRRRGRVSHSGRSRSSSSLDPSVLDSHLPKVGIQGVGRQRILPKRQCFARSFQHLRPLRDPGKNAIPSPGCNRMVVTLADMLEGAGPRKFCYIG